MRNNKKKSEKLTKENITIDEVMIQSALIMVRTLSDSKREGVNVKFETEVDGVDYNIDILIGKVKEKLHLRIINFFKSLFNKVVEVDDQIEKPEMKKV